MKAARPTGVDLCTYRGCGRPAISQLSTAYGGAPWYACDDHAKAMMSALGVGLGASEGVTDTEIEPPPF